MYNTNEEKLIVKGSERITRDLLVNHDAYINGSVEANTVATNELNVANLVADSATINNLAVNNIGIAETTITNAVIDTASINNLNVINVEMSDGTANNFSVVNLVANTIIDNSNAVLNNSIIGDVANGSVLFWNNSSNQLQSLPKPYADNVALMGNLDGSLRWGIAGGGNVNGAPVIIMNESYFVDNLDYNVDNGWDNSVLYVTSPNGNMFFSNYVYLPSAVYTSPTVVTIILNNTNYRGVVTLNLSEPGDITNAFLGSSSIVSAQYKNGQPASLGVNMSLPNTMVTNAKNLYVINASHAFYDCYEMTDCFFLNNSLISNKPGDYNPWTMVDNASFMFFNCKSLTSAIVGSNVRDMSDMYHNCVNITYNSQTLVIPDTVTNMYRAFTNCYNFNQPTVIGNNVVNMSRTFSGCSHLLQDFIIPDSVTDMSYTFASSKVNNVVIGNNVENMSYSFYRAMQNINNLTIPNSVINMQGAFYSASNVGNIVIGNNVQDLSQAFNGTNAYNITVPGNVVNLYRTFYGNSEYSGIVKRSGNFIFGNGITTLDNTFANSNCATANITLPSSVTDMNFTFYNCQTYSAENLTLPNSVRNLVYTFTNTNTRNGQNISIPESVVNMQGTFANCNNLQSPVNLPNNVIDISYLYWNSGYLGVKIGDPDTRTLSIPESVVNMQGTFANCNFFYLQGETITIPKNVTDISQCFTKARDFVPQNVSIPGSVTNMANTFRECHRIFHISAIPASVTNMANTFYDCYYFNQPVDIPASVTNMAYTFYNCQNFNQTSINIPSSVTNLCNTFYNCGFLYGRLIIHINRSIAIGNTQNYIYNALINGYAGQGFEGYILNDA